ncbi:MAG: hypothetical protein LBP23_00600 [Treponema sp.]|jgi:hypothetical protein|nr:hypothetical protein [Treponema sp.]
MTRSALFKPLAVLPWLFLLPALLAAQTASDMDLLLDTEELSYGQAAWIVMEAAEVLVAGEQDRAEAFRTARRWGWLPRQARMEDPIPLRELSLLVMEAFRLRGGIMYSLFHTGRYAHRELVYRQFIQGRADPGRRVSGERLLRILGRVLSYTGEAAGGEGDPYLE